MEGRKAHSGNGEEINKDGMEEGGGRRAEEERRDIIMVPVKGRQLNRVPGVAAYESAIRSLHDFSISREVGKNSNGERLSWKYLGLTLPH